MYGTGQVWPSYDPVTWAKITAKLAGLFANTEGDCNANSIVSWSDTVLAKMHKQEALESYQENRYRSSQTQAAWAKQWRIIESSQMSLRTGSHKK